MNITRNTIITLYIALWIVVIVGVDIRFLKNRFRERLLVNIAIVLLFVVIYLIFLRKP